MCVCVCVCARARLLLFRLFPVFAFHSFFSCVGGSGRKRENKAIGGRKRDGGGTTGHVCILFIFFVCGR
jgi:hypothetical protein